MRNTEWKKPELLAPGGDLMRAKTAIRYGADAVYIGGMNYSLRSRASNFTLEDIAEACRFAKEYGARIHVTVNMIFHDEDYEGLREYLMALEQAGVTAIIAASPYVMRLAKECAPKLQVHCSTQMSITSSETAKFLKDTLDVDRVVLARECTMDEVKAITENSPVETEAFIHGGMCVNYSGRCTLSNRMTLRDANRGGCAQSCRWQYRLYEGEKELTGENRIFTMGSKDLSTAASMYELMEAGVSSLKIEGRMKTEYYIASVVSGYRHLIDAIYEKGAPLSEEELKQYRHEIRRAENRETWGGFYHEDTGLHSLIYHENSDSTVNHDFLGTIESYNTENKVALIQTRNPFAKGDRIEVLRPGKDNQSFTVEWIQNEKGEYLEESRSPMRHLYLPIPFAVEKDDMMRKERVL